MSLNSMLQKQLHNAVPEEVLRQCPEADRTLVENILRLAQAELVVLNLASTIYVCVMQRELAVTDCPCLYKLTLCLR